jgi:beta-lactamase regulating signal transducer with metallopeptidase domain
MKNKASIRRRLKARSPCTSDVPLARYFGIAVTQSAEIEVPAALSRREICVPDASFFQMEMSEQRGVILHEIAHVLRSDPIWMDAARMIAAVTWWQPLNSRVCSLLERDTELAADQHAVALGAQPRALVAGLAFFAGRIETGLEGAGAALLGKDSLVVARARRLLDQNHQSGRLAITRLFFVVAGAVALCAVLPAPTTASPAPLAKPGAAVLPGTTIEEDRIIRLPESRRQP